LEYFRKPERALIFDEVDRYLMLEPNLESNSRKRLRPNELAEWELRLGKYRVFYDVKNNTVKIVKVIAVGYKKHNKLFFRGEEFDL
jgi:mRNA-degrading endonuclease RelE of RelBE toxin-antitoxin system